jgi:hypothetical protein
MEPIMEMVDDRFTNHTLLGQSGMRLSHVLTSGDGMINFPGLFMSSVS